MTEPAADRTETDPVRQGSTERCANPDCGHTKRDHSGRRDHVTKHPNIPLRPWCHACETDCLFEPAAVPVPPPTDRGALRDRIAEALIQWTYRGKDPEHGGILETVRANAYGRADAVLAVLPEPTDRTALSEAERTMLAYALDQAQERIWSEGGFTDEDQAAVTSLRRMAEAQPTTKPETEA